MHDVLGIGHELPGDIVDGVPSLGHRQAQDPDLRIRQQRHGRHRVIRGEDIVNDAADDPGVLRPVRGLGGQGVEVVLAGQGVPHPHIRGHHAQAHNAEIQCLPLAHQCVQVHRLVCAVESADTDVPDAWGDRASVVGRETVGRKDCHLGGSPTSCACGAF